MDDRDEDDWLLEDDAAPGTAPAAMQRPWRADVHAVVAALLGVMAAAPDPAQCS